ncbi:hypothetical protein DFH09DRAFT_1079422 [Mycena vulgaris]|nr:hypothetical protein DFH09DRAFT_1079422 [Mycena vulgaris]
MAFLVAVESTEMGRNIFGLDLDAVNAVAIIWMVKVGKIDCINHINHLTFAPIFAPGGFTPESTRFDQIRAVLPQFASIPGKPVQPVKRAGTGTLLTVQPVLHPSRLGPAVEPRTGGSKPVCPARRPIKNGDGLEP